MHAAEATAGKYRTLRRLAVGGMGEIFLAREESRLSRLVVIKKLLPQLARERASVEMFVDEARIVGHLAHPNICQIIELGDDHGVPFIVLEYVRGESIAAIWDRAYVGGGTLPLPITLRILADAARALHYAHEATDADGRPLRVIHRDVTPHNVMVSFDGDVKLMDFGVAHAENRQHRTNTGHIKGKISYMSPEQLNGRQLDRRADVFALGVMLWELTLQKRLFGGGDEVETLRRAMACDVPAPRSIMPSYPPALEAIVMRALAADRDQRTATAAELATALSEQVTLHGGAERDDIAAIVRGLFPAESAAAPDEAPTVRRAVEAVPRTLSLDVEPVAREPTGRPTVPLRVEPDARPTAPVAAQRAASRGEPSQTETLRTRGRGIAIAVALVAAASIAVVVYAARSDSSRDTIAKGSSTSLPSDAADRVVAPAPADATEVAVEVAPDAAVAVPAHAPPRDSHAKRDHHRVASGSASPPDPDIATPASAPQQPASGWIAVASDTTGVVVIDNQRRKSTPFQTELPTGSHDVAVELAEAGGTLHATVQIATGRKTKCKVETGVLACATSP